LSNRERRSQAPLFISSFLAKPVGIMVVFEVETPARLTIGLEALAHLCTLRVSSSRRPPPLHRGDQNFVATGYFYL